jgi:hypothetical protein
VIAISEGEIRAGRNRLPAEQASPLKWMMEISGEQ